MLFAFACLWSPSLLLFCLSLTYLPFAIWSSRTVRLWSISISCPSLVLITLTCTSTSWSSSFLFYLSVDMFVLEQNLHVEFIKHTANESCCDADRLLVHGQRTIMRSSIFLQFCSSSTCSSSSVSNCSWSQFSILFHSSEVYGLVLCSQILFISIFQIFSSPIFESCWFQLSVMILVMDVFWEGRENPFRFVH